MKTEKSLKVQASEITPKTIGAAIVEFQKKCASHAASQIALTNEAREIGLLVQSWCGHTQMNFDFWQRHRTELPKKVTFEMLKTFVAIATRMPDTVEKLEDARRVWQLDFQAAGLLQIPERIERQHQTSVSHYSELLNRIGAVRNVLVEWNRDEPFETWNPETRQTVAAQIKPLADFYRQLTETEDVK